MSEFESGEVEEDNRINSNVVLANTICKKIKDINRQIIFPGKGVDAGIAADLSEIYVALEKYRELIDKFLAADISNREVMEESLVNVESTLKHVESHIKNAHILFEQMKTYYCWK
jgi:hypothetical protein